MTRFKCCVGPGQNEWNTWDGWGEGRYRSCGYGPSFGVVRIRCRPWPTRSRLRWCAPIRTILSSMRSAPRSGPPTKTCRRHCRAIGRRSRVTASAGYQYTDLNSTFGGTATQIVQVRNSRHRSAAQRRPHGHPDALQRQSNRQQDPRGGEPGLRRARRRCACSNRRCCCRRPPSTWTTCATPPSSRFSAATSAFSNRR